MSMLVLQPSISTVTDCTAGGVEVPVGVVGVLVDVGKGVSVLVSVTGTRTVTPGITVAVKGRLSMIGVAVTMLGVREGIGVQTGNGWGGIPQVSHAARIKINTSKTNTFFIVVICSCLFSK